jgi:hypothetical protein
MGIIKSINLDLPKAGGSTQREKVSKGTHPASIVGVYNLGLQDTGFAAEDTKQLQYKGNKVQHQIKFLFEVDEVVEAEGDFKGKRKLISSKPLTLSDHEKANLTKYMESITGESFRLPLDPESLVGKPVLVTVIHNDNGYDNITGVSSLPPQMKPLKLEHTEMATTPPQFIVNQQNKQLPVKDVEEHMKGLLGV